MPSQRSTSVDQAGGTRFVQVLGGQRGHVLGRVLSVCFYRRACEAADVGRRTGQASESPGGFLGSSGAFVCVVLREIWSCCVDIHVGCFAALRARKEADAAHAIHDNSSGSTDVFAWQSFSCVYVRERETKEENQTNYACLLAGSLSLVWVSESVYVYICMCLRACVRQTAGWKHSESSAHVRSPKMQ